MNQAKFELNSQPNVLINKPKEEREPNKPWLYIFVIVIVLILLSSCLFFFSTSTFVVPNFINFQSLSNNTTDSGVLINGTPNQVIVHTDDLGQITLLTPQPIATSSSPTFAGLTLSNLNGNIQAENGKLVVKALDLSNSNNANNVTGKLNIENGGTGLDVNPKVNELLVGDTSGKYTLKTLQAGSNVTITSTADAMIISSSGSGGGGGPSTTVTPGNGLVGNSAIGPGAITLNVGQGDGIIVTSDAIGLKLASGVTGSDHSDSGLELSSNGVSLIGGCGDGDVLKWNLGLTRWECQVDVGAGSSIVSLNGLNNSTQLFAVGTTGTDFNIVSSVDTHTFNLPSASTTARGVVTINAQTFGGDKTFNNNLLVNGNTTLGDASSDLVTFNARVNSNILPATDNTYALGSLSNRWKDLFLGPASLNISSTAGSSGSGSDYTLLSAGFSGGQAQFITTNNGTNTSGNFGGILVKSGINTGQTTNSAFAFTAANNLALTDNLFTIASNNGANGYLVMNGNGETSLTPGAISAGHWGLTMTANKDGNAGAFAGGAITSTFNIPSGTFTSSAKGIQSVVNYNSSGTSSGSISGFYSDANINSGTLNGSANGIVSSATNNSISGNFFFGAQLSAYNYLTANQIIGARSTAQNITGTANSVISLSAPTYNAGTAGRVDGVSVVPLSGSQNNTASGTTGLLNAYFADMNNAGTVTSDMASALWINRGSGSAANLYGLYLQDLSAQTISGASYGIRYDSASTNTVNDAYGIAIQHVTDGSVNNYGMSIGSVSGGSGQNYGIYLAGASGGTSSAALWVNAGVSHFAPATTSHASIILASSAGTNPSTPGSGDLWWNGTNLNFRTGSSTIDILALGGGGCPSCFAQGGNSLGVTAVLGTTDNNALSIITNNTEAIHILTNQNVGIGVNSPAAILSINSATTSAASLNIKSSAGTNVSSPNSGDIWWNGTNLNFRTGSSTVDLLAGGGGCPSCFAQNGNAFGTAAILGTTDTQDLQFIVDNINSMTLSAAGTLEASSLTANFGVINAPNGAGLGPTSIQYALSGLSGNFSILNTNLSMSSSGTGNLTTMQGVLQNTLGSTLTGDLIGSSVSISNLGSVSGAVVGYDVIFDNADNSVGGDAYGLRVSQVSIGGGTNYGIYLGDVVGGSGSYAIYTNAGDVHFGGNLDIGGTCTDFDGGDASPDGCDVAETFSSQSALEAGDVVKLDLNGNWKDITQTDSSSDQAIGVISTNPTLVMGNKPFSSSNAYPVGLSGVLPTKVINQNGLIKRGDSVAPSDYTGKGKKASAGDLTIGIALEDQTTSNDVINVLISRNNQAQLPVESNIDQPSAEMDSLLLGFTQQLSGLFNIKDSTVTLAGIFEADAIKTKGLSITSNKAGEVSILVGSTGKEVQISGLQSSAKVFLTPTSQIPDGYQYWVEVQDGKFTVRTNQSVTGSPLKFNYFIID